MRNGSFFHRMTRPLRTAYFYWRIFGGFSGSGRKLLSYFRRYGAPALARRLLSLLLYGSRGAGARNIFANAGTDGMVRLDGVDVKGVTPPSICIHIHLFYADLAAEFRSHLQHMPFPFTLLVSVVSEETAEKAREAFADLSKCGRCVVAVAENRGRDMAPFFCAFGDEIARHDIAAHFHSKKSLHAGGMGNVWREYLLGGLLGSSRDIEKILFLFQDNKQLGLVYPQTFRGVPFWGHHWLANRPWAAEILGRLGWPAPDETLCDFPVGSMFWARTAALRPLLDLKLRPHDFEEESGQLDGTLAHALERLIGHCATLAGFEHAVLNMPDNPQLLRWGLEQCQDMEWRLQEPLAGKRVKLVIFDIFDTLLLRPLRAADDTKKIVLDRLPALDAAIYGRWRAEAEEEARVRLNKDVTLDDIFKIFAELAGISPERAAAMQRLETEVELRSVSASPPVVELVNIAREYGVRVVYASDMFLKRETIMEMLRNCGVPEPDHLYLSNEINRRKDAGTMQPYILEAEGVNGNEALVLGDNLRSDIQIASDMKIGTLPVPRMPDMLKASPRTALLAQEPFLTPDDSLSIGLVFRRMRQKARPLDALEPYGFFRDFEGIGYCILGPVLAGFSAWLAREAREKGIEALYFLARDGKIMRHAYEAWRRQTGEGPPSEYLEVSRRAVSVPALASRSDLTSILSLRFLGTSGRMFFEERVGITLSDQDIQELEARGIWPDFSPGADDALRIKQIRAAAEALWPRIREHALREKETALAYLRSMGMAEKKKQAVVDIGYTGSIQRHISTLLGWPLQGFYLLTGSAIARADAPAKGLFAYIEKDCPPHSPFMLQSFRMEKLLSASEGQVVGYRQAGAGGIEILRREFSGEERRHDAAREKLRAGLDAFIHDAGAVRGTLYPDFMPSRHAAMSMWLQLQGLPVLDKELLLDDFYCEGALI